MPLLGGVHVLWTPRERPDLPEERDVREPGICLQQQFYSGKSPALRGPTSLLAVPLTLQICKLPCEAAVALLQDPVLLIQEAVAFPQLLQLLCRGQDEREVRS